MNNLVGVILNALCALFMVVMACINASHGKLEWVIIDMCAAIINVMVALNDSKDD